MYKWGKSIDKWNEKKWKGKYWQVVEWSSEGVFHCQLTNFKHSANISAPTDSL